MRVVRNIVLLVAAILFIAPPSPSAAPATGRKAAKQDAELAPSVHPGAMGKPGAKAVEKPATKPGAKAPAVVKGKPAKPLTKKQVARQAALAAKKSKKQAARQAHLAEKRAAKHPKVGVGKGKAPQGAAARSKKAVE
jgi:hypothetical protein